MTFDHASQTVLLTGASSGIGTQFARELAARGSSLVLVARRAERLEELATHLRQAHGTTVVTAPLDLSSPTAAHELRGLVDERGIRITSLINNAGFGTFGRFVDEELPRLQEEIAVDAAAPMALSSLFLPDLLRTGNGYLINLASMAAYAPTPRMAVYGASKAFVLHFTEALWAETQGTGVKVFALSPGATSTEFNAVVGTDDATAGARMRTPAHVVNTALTHLERRSPGPSIIDSASNRAAAAFLRLFSRRTAVRMLDRVSDPARRAPARTVTRGAGAA